MTTELRFGALLCVGLFILWISGCEQSSPGSEAASAPAKEACPTKYPECRGDAPSPMPDWNVPTDPQEKAAYDYAYSLPTPPSAPQPAPFDFKAARIAETSGGESVAQQYFEHLCSTEAGEFVTRRVANVEGFLLLRPRGDLEFQPENNDRYGTEEPTGIGWLSDDDQLNSKYDFLGDAYVQPLYGVYRFVEYVHPEDASRVIRVERADQGDTTRFPHGVEANWRTHSSGALRAPYLVTRKESTATRSRYAYTWRGLRRDRDRELGIAGGEFLVVDRETNEVLGLKRVFNSTWVPNRPDFTNWYAARECPKNLTRRRPIPRFIPSVLNPDIHVNDDFVPPAELNNYHDALNELMGKNNND